MEHFVCSNGHSFSQKSDLSDFKYEEPTTKDFVELAQKLILANAFMEKRLNYLEFVAGINPMGLKDFQGDTSTK